MYILLLPYLLPEDTQVNYIVVLVLKKLTMKQRKLNTYLDSVINTNENVQIQLWLGLGNNTFN